MAFQDLREFIDKVRELDKVLDIEKAHWNLEIGALTEITAQSPDCPALLFDDIEGYPRGFRILTNFRFTVLIAKVRLIRELNVKIVDLICANHAF